MARDTVRSGVTDLLTLAFEVMVGIGLLFLFLLAAAWDPLDRRLGLRDRRRAARYGGEGLEGETSGEG